VLAGILLVALAAVYPALQIRTDFNLEGFYPKEDEVIRNYEILEQEFGRDDNTILIGFSSDSLLSGKVLTDLKQITDSLKQVPFIEDVSSLWSAVNIRSANGTLRFDSLLTTGSLSPDSLARVRQQIENNPFASGFLVSEDFEETAILLKILEGQNSYENRNRIIASVNSILDNYRQYYIFHISGIPYYRNQYVNLLNDEIVVYIGLSSIFIIALLWFLYRSIWGLLFPMIIVWATLLLTIASMYLTGGYLEIMSSTIAPILLCVGVADAIHMISKYDDGIEHGQANKKSIISMMKMLGSATFLTSITTAIGFATLASSNIIPMKRFGIYTAAGVLIAYLITIFFLPAVLSYFNTGKVFSQKSSFIYDYFRKILTRVTVLNRRYNKQIVFGTLALTFLIGLGISKLEVNGRIFDDIEEDTQIMQDSRFFSENLTPQFPMEFIIGAGRSDGVLSAGLVNKLEEFEHFLLSFPEIHKVTGFHTLVREVHQTLQPGSGTDLPEDDNAVAQYALLLEVNSAGELERFANFDYSTARVTAFTEDAGSGRINEIRGEIESWINQHIDDYSVTVTGTTILSADLTEKIVYSLAWSILLAIAAISVIMAMLFKNFRLVIISLIPNLLPLVIIGGIMGFMGIAIKPSTAVIFTISLGIAVDDSIHYLARFRLEYLKGKPMHLALRETTVKTGRAIIITSMILIAGFGTLISSSFTSTTMMGLLVCTTIGAALIADLLLLPSLFYLINPKLSIRENGKKDLTEDQHEPREVLSGHPA